MRNHGPEAKLIIGVRLYQRFQRQVLLPQVTVMPSCAAIRAGSSTPDPGK
jgi:hypothetical protein